MTRNFTISDIMSTKLVLNICIAILPLMTICVPTYAQTKVGLQAGVNFSGVTAENESGNEETTRSMPGILLGLTAYVPVISNFYVQPGIFYAKKGFKQATGGYYGLANNFEVKVSYVELPFNILYKPKLATGRLMLGAGPYVGYGTGGTWESDNVIQIGDIMTDSKGKTIFKDDFEDGEFGNYLYGRPWDYGLNFLAGYEFLGNFSAQVNVQAGLANLQPKTGGKNRDGSLRNNSLGFTVGYKF
jgi:hypothetical protein